MNVLAYMNTASWSSMGTPDREEGVQCPCECGMQNIGHVISECEYMVDYLFGMVETVDYALQTGPEAAQRKWPRAHSMRGKVAAIVGTETSGVPHDALGEVAASLKLLVRRAEQALRTVNKADESWPADNLVVCSLDGDGPQLELQIDVTYRQTTNRWRWPDSHALIRRRAHGERHAHPTHPAPTPPHGAGTPGLCCYCGGGWSFG